MVVPGIIRKINKNLPNLLQVILLICLFHFVSQSVWLKRKFQIGRYAKFNPSVPKVMEKKKNSNFKKFNHGVINPPSTTTTTTTTPPPPPPYHVTEKVMQERLKTLHDGCAKWNLGSHGNKSMPLSEDDKKEVITLPKTPIFQALFVSEKMKLSYCPIVRAGSNWVSKRLLELTKQYSAEELKHLKQPPSVLARQQYPYLSSWEKYSEVLPNYVNFLVVRHPFDRLLASYRSILEDAEKDPHNYLKYGRRIVRTIRKIPGGGKEPSFSEFVSFVIGRDVKYLDEAWQPVSRRCTPCQIPYTVIMHYETLWNDTLWTWETSNLPELNTTDYVTNSITSDIRRKYFSEITIHQLSNLHHKYRIDFDLLGYKLDEHILYAQPGDEPLTSDILKALPLSPQKTPDDIKANEVEILNATQEESQVNSEETEIETSNVNRIEHNDIHNFPEAIAPLIPN